MKAMMAWVAASSLNPAGDKSVAAGMRASQCGPNGHRLSCSVGVGQGLMIPRLGLAGLWRGWREERLGATGAFVLWSLEA